MSIDKKDLICSLWRNTSKSTNKPYFSGKIGNDKLVGFYNTTKNEKAPRVRIYYSDKFDEKHNKVEFVALWLKTSKNGKKYLSGKVNNLWVMGFINDNPKTANSPYINLYWQNNDKPDKNGDMPF